jgi:hypothetical protein
VQSAKTSELEKGDSSYYPRQMGFVKGLMAGGTRGVMNLRA